MAKVINLTYGDTTYHLEYTRKTAEILETAGFDINAMDSQRIRMIRMLFAGAFVAHHRMLKQDKIDEIFENVTHKDELLMALAAMYNDTALSLMAEPEDTASGKAEWTVSQ